MADDGFRLPGFSRPLANPDACVSNVLRIFREAAQALGWRAADRLGLRRANPANSGRPDYQIGMLDGEDATTARGRLPT